MGPTGGPNIPYFFAKEGGVNKDQPGKLGALLWAYRGKRNGFCDGSTCLVMRVERIYGSVLFYEFYIYMCILLYIVKMRWWLSVFNFIKCHLWKFLRILWKGLYCCIEKWNDAKLYYYYCYMDLCCSFNNLVIMIIFCL